MAVDGKGPAEYGLQMAFCCSVDDYMLFHDGWLRLIVCWYEAVLRLAYMHACIADPTLAV